MPGIAEGPTQEEVDSINWWHAFTFPNGVKTRGTKGGGSAEYCREVLQIETESVFRYPVNGKTVLDVGANNGYFSVEAARRGGKRVLAFEKWAWENDGFKAFELARRYLAPNIEAIKGDVMDLRSQPVGKFDCIFFLGVLYHLKHPLYVLETLFDLTIEHLVVETHLDLTDCGRSAMAFYPGAELGDDASNWWGPNVECVVDMLKTVGFSRVEHALHPLTNLRGFFYAFK